MNETSANPFRILIAESDEGVINALSARLPREQCWLATTADELYRRLGTREFDVIFLNPSLPGMVDLGEFLTELRDHESAEPSFILLSSDAVELAELFAAGAHGSLDPDDLDEDTLDECVGTASFSARMRKHTVEYFAIVNHVGRDDDGNVPATTTALANECFARAGARVVNAATDDEQMQAVADLFERALIDFMVGHFGNTQTAADALDMSFAELQQWLRDENGDVSQ